MIIGPFSLIPNIPPLAGPPPHSAPAQYLPGRNPLICVLLGVGGDPASRDLSLLSALYIYIWAGRDARSGRLVTPYTPLHPRLVRTYRRNLKHAFGDSDILRLRPQMNGNPVRCF